MDDVHGQVHNLGQRQGAFGGFRLASRRTGVWMPARLDVAGRQVAGHQPHDDVVILGVDDGQSALLPEGFQRQQHVGVRQADVVVCHIDLKTGHTGPNDSLYFGQTPLIGAVKAHVKTEVNDRLRVSLGQPGFKSLHPGFVGAGLRKINQCGSAATGSGHGASEPVVTGDDTIWPLGIL